MTATVISFRVPWKWRLKLFNFSNKGIWIVFSKIAKNSGTHFRFKVTNVQDRYQTVNRLFSELYKGLKESKLEMWSVACLTGEWSFNPRDSTKGLEEPEPLQKGMIDIISNQPPLTCYLFSKVNWKKFHSLLLIIVKYHSCIYLAAMCN